MRSSLWGRGVNLLLVLATLQPQRIAASSPINVALQTSFDSAPYLVELLETAAEEKPNVYFPLLDRIAEGYFDSSTTDQQLYERFVHLLQDDKLITDPESLSSFQLALSIRNAAPRIEAHYQYYKTAIEPSLGDGDCDTWIELGGKQYCDPNMEKEHSQLAEPHVQSLPFDRVLGTDSPSVPGVLYADITTPTFRKFHQTAAKAARDGKGSYRVRYKPSKGGNSKPLVINGYGVELALKRTDYIVIDDRQKEESTDAEKKVSANSGEVDFTDDDVADLKPLSASELENLGLNAASFVASSENPLDTLLKLTQDFPKHSGSLVNQNASEEFLTEHVANREHFLPSGFNVMWINGVQYDPRKMDAFSILDHLRRERKLIGHFQGMGLSSASAISLLSHSAIAEAQSDTDTQRYDWRDHSEGGNVILWLNDITKDRRYKDWPEDLISLLQRTFPGQMPPVRRDIHNAIFPVDFSNPKEAKIVAETILDIVKRKVPVRWGLVPITNTPEAAEQARVIYHMHETYGLVSLMEYLETAVSSRQKTLKPQAAEFKTLAAKRDAREDRQKLSLQEVLDNADLEERLQSSKKYLRRLGASDSEPPLFVNGVPVKKDDDWLSSLSQRVTVDLRMIQKGVFEETFKEETWLPAVFLNGSSISRNPLLIPEDEKDVTLLNLPSALGDHVEILKDLATISVGSDSDKADWAQLIVVGDFDSAHSLGLAAKAVQFRATNDNINLVLIHNANSTSSKRKSSKLLSLVRSSTQLKELYSDLESLAVADPADVSEEAGATWPETQPLLRSLRLKPGESGILLNGRSIGPIPVDNEFSEGDFEILYGYENKKRILPARQAISDLGLFEKLQNPMDAARLYSLLAISTISDIPEGIFELPPPIRGSIFYDWQDLHTAITVGDNRTAVIQIVASIDPASEAAQRWVPILKVLSQLGGVSLKIFLNPKERLGELPVKRFYRYVLNDKPSFNEDGSLQGLAAKFTGIPAQALLTVGMDVPPSWLVTSKESVHDLDNIKLSSLSPGAEVDALYELEYILIEGHSRDSTAAMPPRGAQLVLSTAGDAHVADTIIMSNLGYFQFKANPGHFNIDLKTGPSREIFHIDSVGALGYEPQPGDDSTEVTLLSFLGVTLYPRLSRKPGMETEDVLAAPSSNSAAANLVQQGASFVGGLLQKAGVGKDEKTKAVATKHADINIFSVASGHLYERMLNIMMLSVMRHTNHTVKFWFIEQFLSPSFKAFVPTLAAEYGFQYEMVTYKWPHWLRAQKEKQREIWGYKILFLDVLFPLDLDKVIFVDADQIVRTDMMTLNEVELENGAPYGFTPMCDSRTEMEGFRFWKQGYWKGFLRGLPYHISALYVVDLQRFRAIAAGDRLRQQYHQLSADPNSLSNLDQDLPNNMQMTIPIHSLPQEWLWCETWCSDESLGEAKTIDLCNNPQTKEPKLERARRQVPEWTEYDDEIAAFAAKVKGAAGKAVPLGGVQEEEQLASATPKPHKEKDEL